MQQEQTPAQQPALLTAKMAYTRSAHLRTFGSGPQPSLPSPTYLPRRKPDPVILQLKNQEQGRPNRPERIRRCTLEVVPAEGAGRARV